MEPNYLVLLGIVIVIIGFALKLDAILIIIVDDHGQRVRRDHRDDRGHRRAVRARLWRRPGGDWHPRTDLRHSCTPMAANFNIVPVAMLDMKDRMGVIKKQVLPAMVMIVVQIVYMLIAQ